MTSKELVIKTIRGENSGRTPVYGWVEANLGGVIAEKYGSVHGFEDHYEEEIAEVYHREIRRVFGLLKGKRWLCCTTHFVQEHCSLAELEFAYDLITKLARE